MDTDERSNTEAGSESDQDVNPLQCDMKNILDLPEEMLGIIFQKSTHTERLISRLVCHRWNDNISRDLARTAYFELTPHNEEIFDGSNAQWQQIKMLGAHLALSEQSRNLITALQVNLPESKDWMELLTGFPNLQKLKVNLNDDKVNSEDPVKKSTTVSQLPLFRTCQVFSNLLQKLEHLSITFNYNNFTRLNKFLEEFDCERMRLTKLRITENQRPTTDSTGNQTHGKQIYEDALEHVYRLIYDSSKTLNYLDLDFNSEKFRDDQIPVLVTRLRWLNLKLQTVLIAQEKFDVDVFAIFKKFLKTQMSSGFLKNILLPWTSDASLCQQFVNSLSPDIQSVGHVRSEHITTQFPGGFENLKRISIREVIAGHMFVFFDIGRNIQELEMNNRKHNFTHHYFERIFSGIIVSAMWNLTKLEVIGLEIRDNDLQFMIVNCQQLRILHLEDCGVTDCAVTGYCHSYGSDSWYARIQESISTKRIYLYPNTFPTEDLMKTSISSLVKLEQLVLIGSEITDVGIVMGLQFGSRLKKLSLGSTSREVSDLGLHCLGTHNPGLEVFHGSFISPKISTIGVENFRSHLRMIESTRKFKFINQVEN